MTNNRSHMKAVLVFMSGCLLALGTVGAADPVRNTYEVSYRDEVPDDVGSWSRSGVARNPATRETRFQNYDDSAAEHLILDATVDRGVAKDKGSLPRETAFCAAYDDRGVHIYIEGREPLIDQVKNALMDPRSAAHKEALEVFFSPGLSEVPYYQIFINPYENKATIYDWGSPCRSYRSLETYCRIESRILKNGFGVYVFVPWEAIYEYIPRGDVTWRFTVVRWMPFGKAGGVTWGGKVHQTGDFGLLHFRRPTEEQLEKVEMRLGRYAWYRFLALSAESARFWDDDKLGDRKFFTESLNPKIGELTEIGKQMGPPEKWSLQDLPNIRRWMPEWMEFNYVTSELRSDYLRGKLIRN